jgi:leucyl aminopeptidase (aminopeptidase T)
MAMASQNKFGTSVKISKKLARAAQVAMREVLKVKRGESVLIITNPGGDVQLISMALYDAALDSGGAPAMIFQPVKSQLEFADDAVVKALGSEPAVAISVSKHKLGRDRSGMKKKYRIQRKTYDHIFNYLLASKRLRAFWSPSVTVDMFERTIPVDYRRLVSNCARLKRVFDGAEEAHISTPLGTDLLIGLRGRKALADDGNFSKPGTGGNLPAGEIYISPELGTGEGTLVYDGCISSDRGVIIIDEPIAVTVKRNLVTKISGGREAGLLRATLRRAEKMTRRFGAEGKLPKQEVPRYLENIYNLGELGIGLNEKARIVGNMLEDEKVFKTCHIAIGSNYDEDAKALVHLDGLVRNPTIAIKDKRGTWRTVLKRGKIVI